MKVKLLALITAVALSATLFAVASSATGAYFSDTKTGGLNGDGAEVTVAAGSNAQAAGGLTFNWPSMLPGEVNGAKVFYSNTGEVPQDVWMVFPNTTALSALNSLGAYGAVQIFDSSAGQIFYSNNLLDHPHDTQGVAGPDGRGIIRMLPKMVKIRSNVPVGGSGDVTFNFQYASKLGNGTTGSDFSFNTYPAPYTGGNKQDLKIDPATGAQTDQVYIDATEGHGTGLPFQIVATQVGIEPGAAGTFAGF